MIDQHPFIDQEVESVFLRGEGASSSAAFESDEVAVRTEYIGRISSIDNKLAKKESRLSTKRLFQIFQRKK